MGLDITLYDAFEAAQNEAYNKASDAWYEEGPDGKSPYDKATEAERKAWHEQYSYASGTDVPSERYPDRLFNRRYLRSSYNGGGFNHAVPQMLGTSKDSYPTEYGSLYWIFEPMGREWDGDDGALTLDDIPKLEACKARALEVAEKLRNADRLRVMTVSPNMFSDPPTHTDDDALRMFRAHLAERKAAGRELEDGNWYSSRDMDVFGGGLSVIAAIPGKATFNIPGVHLIYRAEGDGHESYVQSAEITAEFCDEAIALLRKDGAARMSWSG